MIDGQPVEGVSSGMRRRMNRGPWTVRAKRSVLILLAAGFCARLTAQQLRPPAEGSSQAVSIAHDQTSDGYKYNKQHNELNQRRADVVKNFPAEDYRLGPEDLLEVSVFEAPELNRTVRVSGGGKISMPLLGIVQTAGMTPRELEFVLEELLRRTYMKDPHVAVFVREMQSHPVSVFGAVKKPGVFQIRGAKTLVEVLSLAEGLAEDAGDTVTVMRRAGLAAVSEQIEDPSAMPLAVPVDTRARKPEAIAFPQRNENTEDGNAVQISLKNLLESGDQRYNVLIYPGDLVKVRRAGIVYVVGEVKKPGGFILKTNENIT